MAVLAVKIEQEASLLMNEFFDYDGKCYAISRTRLEGGAECIALEDFYECTIRSTVIEKIPVIFVFEGKIVGWYRYASVYRNLQRISVFLEGNICAKTGDVFLLPKAERIENIEFNFREKFYEVIETGDERHLLLTELMEKSVRSLDIAYSKVSGFYSGETLRLAKEKHAICIEKCAQTALRVMQDECNDIRELKTMYEYAKQSLVYNRYSVDGWYYMAMACEQLGFVKEGLKAINKALVLEADGDDLLMLKGHLLYALQKYDEAQKCYQEAIEICPEDSYRMCLGQLYLASGNVDAAYSTYKNVTDKSVLEEAGVNLKAMEKRWPFVAMRGFSLKELFKAKH